MKYMFGDFTLNTDTYELNRCGKVQNIEPQVFALLRTLIENQDKVLSKDQLIDLIWDGRPMSDSVVSSCIKFARRAIDDDGSAQRLIKTVHGYGFRFIGQATKVEDITPLNNLNHSTIKEKSAVIDSADTKPAILVLPFTSVNTPESFPVLPDGFATDIILGLSRMKWLKVIARASAFQLGDQNMPSDLLISKTGAKYCLSGSVELSGSNLFLTIELSNMVDNAIIWIERIHGNVDDIHQLRADIVTKAMGTLEVQISSQEAQIAKLASPENLDTWSAYHLGMAHLNRFTEHDNKIAISLFEQAIKLEPLFARTHAALSFAHFWNVFNRYPGVDVVNSVMIASKSAERSIELDALDPFANFVMGRTFWLAGEAERSIPWIERSLMINPNYAQAHYIHGLAGVMTEQEIDSHKDAIQAMSLSPLDPFMFAFHGVRTISFIAEGDYENARKSAELGARQPGAIFMSDLVAAIANLLAGNEENAQYWMSRLLHRKPDVDMALVFKAFPFCKGETRNRIHASLLKLGIK